MDQPNDTILPMRILAGWNGSDASRDALNLAADLTCSLEARLIVGCVLDPGPTPPALSRQRDEWAARLGDLATAARCEIPDMDFSLREMIEEPVAGLRELALEESADLVVLGETHRGAPGRLIPGSVAERLLQDPPCAIAIAPHDYTRTEPHGGYGIVGVGYDGSPSSRAALAFAGVLAKATDGEIRIVSVVPDYVTDDVPLGPLEPLRQERYQRVRRAQQSVPDEIQSVGELGMGDPAVVLEAEAAELDLLVIGSRGRGPIRDRLLGSVSADVIRKAPCPVIVVRSERSA